MVPPSSVLFEFFHAWLIIWDGNQYLYGDKRDWGSSKQEDGTCCNIVRIVVGGFFIVYIITGLCLAADWEMIRTRWIKIPHLFCVSSWERILVIKMIKFQVIASRKSRHCLKSLVLHCILSCNLKHRRFILSLSQDLKGENVFVSKILF